MPVISFFDIESHPLSSFRNLAWELLLLATLIHPYRADDPWPVYYKQNRFYRKVPGHVRFEIYMTNELEYINLDLRKTYPPDVFNCLSIGEYRNDTEGYAVCNIDPPHAFVETLVRDTVVNNISSLSLTVYPLPDRERDSPGFQCMRFISRILNPERDVRVSNLTSTPCPGLSFASLLYLHPYLSWVQIHGLPLLQDPSNVSLACPMSSRLEELDLQNNGLTSTPFSSCPTYFSNLKYVSLENQQLRLDDKPLFTLSNHLEYLILNRCFLQNLPRSTFVGLIHLKMLNITNNNISSLQKEVFHYLTNLITLHLDNNALTTLDMSVFRGLISLQYLHLGGNLLNRIDGKVAILPSLRVIDLSDNKFTVVRKKIFGDSPMLTVITLNHNNISTIESEAFFNMTAFRALTVSDNALTNVHPCSWFDAVTNIYFLLLAHNSITNIDGIQCLSKMKVFNLFDNELSTIPTLTNLVNLEILDLGRNAIHYVSGDEVTPTTRLRYLFLDGNEMLRLGVLSNSSSIIFLDLQVNNLTYIPAFCFDSLQSLKTLNLSCNYVKYIGEFAFPQNLQELGLYGNELLDLGSNIEHLSQLQKLQIGHNNLTQFNIKLPSVMYFDISENPLENLALQLCTKMPILQEIFLEKLGIGHNGNISRDLFGILGAGCDRWRHLSLASNLIRKIDDYTIFNVNDGIDYSHNPLESIPRFRQINTHIKYLHFYNCSIENIAPMAFHKFQALTYVELKGNNIKYFPPMSQGGIRYDLRNNPIVCSCHLRWLHGHPTRSNYLFTNCIDPVTSSVEVFDLLPIERLVCQHQINCAPGCVCLGLDIYTVDIVNCSSRSLTAIPSGLSPEADVIYLDHNQFNKPHFSSEMDKMAACQLFLQDSKIKILEHDLFTAFSSLQVIDLSNNELETWNIDMLHSLHDLKTLFLHGNRIHQIYGGVAEYNLPSLQIITLHENELHVVPDSIDFAIHSTSFTNLTLAGNPWQCAACAGPIFRKWLAQHAGIVSDAADIQCNKSHLPVLDISMATLEYARCINATHIFTNIHWGITGGLTASLVLLGISLVLTYFFRDHILVLLYNNFDFLKRRRRELDVLYDVRVIYDETDERVRQWVVDKLLQVLEAQWGLDVFLVERDMLAGGNHAEDIAQSIHQSRRTLILVSKNFADNEWAQFAYQAAFQFQMENHVHRVLVVAWEAVETDTLDYNIKVYFKTKQVMWRTSPRFWPVLKSKLPLGRENIDQTPDNIQLNLVHNDWKQI